MVKYCGHSICESSLLFFYDGKVYQLQFELRKAQTERDFERQRSLKCPSPSETQKLQDEISALRRQLLVPEKYSPVSEEDTSSDFHKQTRISQTHCGSDYCHFLLSSCFSHYPSTLYFSQIFYPPFSVSLHSPLSLQAREDILAQDLVEVRDGHMELAEQLRCYREENEQLARERREVCVSRRL